MMTLVTVLLFVFLTLLVLVVELYKPVGDDVIDEEEEEEE